MWVIHGGGQVRETARRAKEAVLVACRGAVEGLCMARDIGELAAWLGAVQENY
jgi:hypothetical protein